MEIHESDFENQMAEEEGIRELKTINPLWNLHDDLSIDDAASLIAGYDPSKLATEKQIQEIRNPMDSHDFILTIPGLHTTRSALINASNAGKLKTVKRYSSREYGSADFENDHQLAQEETIYIMVQGASLPESEKLSEDYKYVHSAFPDWGLSTVNRDDLIDWLRNRGVTTGFFFPIATDSPDYLDSKNSRYAPKLAAALTAWKAVTDPSGKSPKQALEKWLRQNAAQFGLVNDEGKVIETAVEECSKVANWSQSGGAPKTPST